LAIYDLLEAMRKRHQLQEMIFTLTSAVYNEPEVIPTFEKYSPLKPISLYERTFGIFNVGSADRITLLDIANIIIKELSLNNVSLRFLGDSEGRGWKCDVGEFLLNYSKLKVLDRRQDILAGGQWRSLLRYLFIDSIAHRNNANKKFSSYSGSGLANIKYLHNHINDG
jgi:hypothetical protein